MFGIPACGKKQNKNKFEETDISYPEQQRKDEVV